MFNRNFRHAVLRILLAPAAVLLVSCGLGHARQDQSCPEPEAEYWRNWWLVKIIGTEEEFGRFARLQNEDSLPCLSTQADQRAWLAQWWRGLDLDWTTPENERRRFIDSLISVADIRYSQAGVPSETNPPWDEPGQYYIKLGPPDEEETAKKMLKSDPLDNERTTELMLEEWGMRPDIEQRLRAETDAVVWTWYPAAGRNQRLIKVQFQLDKTLNWAAVPVVNEGAELLGGLHLTDLAQGGDMIDRLLQAPIAEFTADDRDPIPVSLDRVRFHHWADSTDLWLTYAFPLAELIGSDTMASIRCTFNLRKTWMPGAVDSIDNGNRNWRSSKCFSVHSSGQESGELAMQVQRFTLPSGDYQLGFRVDNLDDSTKGVTGRMKVRIVPYVNPQRQKTVSDAMILAAAPLPALSGDSDFARDLNQLPQRLTPLPSRVLSDATDSLRVYHEAYNLSRDQSDSSRVLLTYLLYEQSALSTPKPDTLLHQFIRLPFTAASFYRAFPVSDLSEGEYFLAIETVDLNDPDNIDLRERRWTAVGFKIE